MSSRLTYSSHAENTTWPRLTFPFMLMLGAIALIPIQDTSSREIVFLELAGMNMVFSLELLAILVLMGHSGLLLRKFLPAKSSMQVKAFAGICGLGLPFFFIQGFLPVVETPYLNFTGTALLLSSWIFLLYEDRRWGVWTAASGLCAGLAVTLSPVCLAGLPAAVCYLLFAARPSLKTKGLKLLLWAGAFVCGLIPLLNGAVPFPAFHEKLFGPQFLEAAWLLIRENTPIWSWPFVLLGLGVSVMQKNRVVLALVLPFFICRILVPGLFPTQLGGVESTLLLPLAWFTAYGMVRLLKGTEQGARKINSVQAKKIPLIASICFIVGFLLKVGDLFYFYS